MSRKLMFLFQEMCFLKIYIYLQWSFPIATDELVNAKVQKPY